MSEIERHLFTGGSSVQLGPACRIDPTVLLGYHTGRSVKSPALIIGGHAVIRSNTVIYLGSRIGEHFETGHNVVVREENQLGDRVQIWNCSVIDYGCVIGDGVHIHCNVYIAQFSVLESGVFLAPGVTLANDLHPGCVKSRQCMRGPTLHRNVRVGVNATLLPFIEIGEDSLIGSGAVVTRDVPPRSVVFGNPARVCGRIEELTCQTGLSDYPYRDKK